MGTPPGPAPSTRAGGARRCLPGSPTPWVVMLLVGATLALYAPADRLGFVNYDDDVNVTDNAHVRAGLTPAGIRWAATSLDGFWHPLTWLSLQLDSTLYGLDPAGFHRTNVLLHVFNTVLLFLVLRRLTGQTGRGAAVALLFALHPLHVETVAWVSLRKDLLSTAFGLLTVGAYAWYARRPHPARYLAVLAAFCLGLMAKPMVVTLPLALLLLDYWPLRRVGNPGVAGNGCRLLRLVAEKLPLLLAAAAVGGLTVVAEQNAGALRLHAQAPLSWRLRNAVGAVLHYLAATFWPSGLAVFYPAPTHPTPWGTVLAGGAVLLGAWGLALAARRRYPYLAVGWLWFLGSLVPVLGLLQIGSHLVADRYTYWPHVGLLVLLVWAAADLVAAWGATRLAATLGAAVGVACLVASRQQLATWHDSRALWTNALAVTADNWLAHNNLATHLLLQGRTDEAVAEYEEAARVRPDYASPYASLGLIALERGERTAARSCLDVAVRLGYRHGKVYTALGGLDWLDGRVAAARANAEAALQLDPNAPDAHTLLGVALLAQGQAMAAEGHFRQALQLGGQSAELCANLGAALYNQGRVDEAIDQLAQAVRLDARYAAGHFKLGLALQRRGRLVEALREEDEALRLNPALAEAHRLRGLVLEGLGRGAEAVASYREAARLQSRDPR